MAQFALDTFKFQTFEDSQPSGLQGHMELEQDVAQPDMLILTTYYFTKGDNVEGASISLDRDARIRLIQTLQSTL